MDIKLKNNIKKTSKKLLIYFVTIIFLLILCFKFYYWINIHWSTTIRNWFSENLMARREISTVDEMYKLSIIEPQWHTIKQIFLITLCIIVVLWTTSIFITAWLYAEKRVNQTISNANKMVHFYMIDNMAIPDIYKEENAELFAQMVEIKSTIQHHEQILKEESTRKNDLIVYLAHDLKTPLTSIIGYLSLLKEIPEMPIAQQSKYINITLDKALRLEKLINEFFDITRYNLSQISLEKESINLYYMLVQLTDEFYPIFQAHGNTISLQADENLILYGDSEKLARVFNNILKNAVAYSYSNTEIQIFASGNEKEIHIDFQNTGKTIPKHKLESIFDKFFRLDESRSVNTGCAGLGLAISKEIITLHGGTIWAESEHEQTTFHIILPS